MGNRTHLKQWMDGMNERHSHGRMWPSQKDMPAHQLPLGHGGTGNPPDAPAEIDRRLFRHNEGGDPDQQVNGYVPVRGRGRDAHPDENSGVTFGIGVDLAQHTRAELQRWGIPDQILAKLPVEALASGHGHYGLRGQAAENFLSHHPLGLTEGEARLVSERLLAAIATSVGHNFDAAHPATTFSHLQPRMMTLLVDLAYNLGPGFGLRHTIAVDPAHQTPDVVEKLRAINDFINGEKKLWRDFITNADHETMEGDLTAVLKPGTDRQRVDVDYLNGGHLFEQN